MVSLGERERKQEKTSVSNAGRKQNAIKSSIITGPRVHGKMETAEGRREWVGKEDKMTGGIGCRGEIAAAFFLGMVGSDGRT
jgi:hypothetical protein